MRLAVAALLALALVTCGSDAGNRNAEVPQGNADAVADQYKECGPLVAEWERVDAEVTEQPKRGQLLTALGRRMNELGCSR